MRLVLLLLVLAALVGAVCALAWAPFGDRAGSAATASAVDAGPSTCPPGRRQALIVVDRSASAQTGDATRRLFADSLRRAVRETLHCEGDVVQAVLAHRETSGKAGAARVEASAERHSLAGGTKAGQAQQQSAYRVALQDDRARALRRVRHVADSVEVTRELRRHTDLLGVLRVVADEMPASDGLARTVYVFGDLHESMTGPGRRDFDARPPTSAAEAGAWAAEDVALVQAVYGVGPDVLAGARVVAVRGEFANRPSALAVRQYWTALWTALGARAVSWP